MPSKPFSWQLPVWDRLCRQLSKGKLPHALLVTGVVGVGKQHFANAFCQRLLCSQGKDDHSCGQCKQCQLLKSGNHPDFHWIGFEEKAQAIKIDQIRTLVSALGKTPQIGVRHCVVIEAAHLMNISAANALLKLLEEPPGDAVFLLTSAYSHRLAATVRSRCQQVVLPTPNQSEALAWLVEEGVAEREAAAALELAGGTPLKALTLIQSNGIEAYHSLATQLASVLTRRVSVVAVAADFAARHDTDVVDAMLSWLHLHARNNQSYSGSESLPEALRSVFSGFSDSLAMFRFYDKLGQMKAQLLSSANPNKSLLWEECLLDWQALVRPAATSGATNAAN